MDTTINYDTNLVYCCDSDVGPIQGCSGHLELLHNQLGPFNRISGFLTKFSAVVACFHLISFFLGPF